MVTVSRTVEIQAPAAAVWELVSDLPGMGAYSPENAGGRWVSGTGPRPGAVFKGANRNGVRRWSTKATVTDCEPGRSFAFRVEALGLRVADWSYRLDPSTQGCTVTETWVDRRGTLMRLIGVVASGTVDREAFTVVSIDQTLAKLKSRAEGA